MGFIIRGLVSRLPHTRPSIRWTAALSVLLTAAVLGNLLLPAVGFGQQAGPADQPFGPVLFSIATTPTATTGEALPAAVPPTVVLHAKLDTPQGPLYIASGAAADVTALTASGVVTATVLDDNTAGDPQDTTTRAVYYFADASDPAAADNAIVQAGPIAKVIYRDANVLLVRSTAATELALVETLSRSGVPISLLSSAALAPESPAAPSPAPAASTAANTAAQASVPDPTVAALLPKLTEADLRALIDRLSGQVAVTVGGQTLSLSTRYTFATRVQDAARYVYEYYQNLGIPVSYSPWTYGSYSGQNVVAEVRGAVNPEKVLIVGGHLDDISESPYTVAPGGDDNGTGTAATMLIAKLLKDYRPDVTVRFVHFTAEEQGHWGSIVYAAGLRNRGEQVIGFIDLDMFGYDGNKDRVVEIHTGTGPKSNAFGASFQERNTRYGLGLNFEQKTTTASRFSDHSSFWDQDYASFLIIENFFDDAITRDRNPWYHNTGDLPVRVDYDYTARIARVALATMFELGGYKDAGAPTPTPTATPTGQPTPTPTPTNTPTPVPTPDPGGCTNLLVNGDFEGSTGWSFGSTPFPARYVTSPVYSGARAVTLGMPTGNANRLAHSSAYQRITIPANAPSPVVLRYMERPGGAADGVDYREALLLDTSYGYLASLRRDRAAGNSQWIERSFDLTAYRGKTVVLYFNVYNDGKGQQMWNTVDRAQLGGCTKSQAALDANGAPIPAPAVDPTLAAWHVFLPSLAK